MVKIASLTNDDVLNAHDVILQADGIEAVDVLRGRNEHLASEMATLLCSCEKEE